AMHLTVRQSRAVDERCVVEPVEEQVIVAADQRGDGAEARLIARGEYERGGRVRERGGPRRELELKGEGAVVQAAASRTAAVAMQCALRGLENARVMRETEIVVRADHDLPLAPDSTFGGGRLVDRHEVRIDPGRARLLSKRVLVALREERHATLTSGIVRRRDRPVVNA